MSLDCGTSSLRLLIYPFRWVYYREVFVDPPAFDARIHTNAESDEMHMLPGAREVPWISRSF